MQDSHSPTGNGQSKNRALILSVWAMEPSAAMSAALAHNWWVVALRGLLGIAFGLVALFWPGITILSLVLIFAAYSLIDGVFEIAAAVRAAQRHQRWGLLLLSGIISIAMGCVAFFWPGITVIAFVLLLAIWALASGILMLASAPRLEKGHGRWWLVLGGLVSVLYGALLLLAPRLGAVVLTWWIGAYALIFGGTLLALAFKLRSRQKTLP